MLGSCRIHSGAVLCPSVRTVAACKPAARARLIHKRVQAQAARFAAQAPTSGTGGNGVVGTQDKDSSTQQANAPSPGVSIQENPPLLPPPAIFAKAVELGTAKANLPIAKCFALSLMGGIFIAFGGALHFSVGPSCRELAASNPGLVKILTGLVGLPFGLLLVLVCGAELFSGNTALVGAARFNGKCTTEQLVRNWGISYIGNQIGILGVIALLDGAGIFSYHTPGILSTAITKVGLTFQQAFFSGILANWFVCLATWMASGSNSLVSKLVAVYLPISSFIVIGLEHGIANMFIIPLAISLGADITVGTYLVKNLLPVTLGNMIGGALGVAGFYSFVYGNLGKKQPQQA